MANEKMDNNNISGWRGVVLIASFVLIIAFALFNTYANGWDVRHKQGLEALEKKDYQKAEFLLREAYHEAERSRAPAYELGTILGDLGETYENLKDKARAEDCYLKGLELFEKSAHLDNPKLAYHLERIGGFYLVDKRLREAEPYLARAFSMNERLLAPDDETLGYDASMLGNLYMAMGRYAEAEPLLKQAYAIHQKALKPEASVLAFDKESLRLLEVHKKNPAKPFFSQ